MTIRGRARYLLPVSDGASNRARPFRLTSPQKGWVYGTFLLLWLSGITWWILHRFAIRETEFGAGTHPAEPWMLKLHGAASMVSLLVLGALIPLHAQRAWPSRINRLSALILSGLLVVLVVTAYGLYYIPDEAVRQVVHWIHLVGGGVLPLVLFWHIRQGRRETQSIPPSTAGGQRRD